MELDCKVGENISPPHPPQKKQKKVLNLHRLIDDQGAQVFGAKGGKSVYKTHNKQIVSYFKCFR